MRRAPFVGAVQAVKVLVAEHGPPGRAQRGQETVVVEQLPADDLDLAP